MSGVTKKGVASCVFRFSMVGTNLMELLGSPRAGELPVDLTRTKSCWRRNPIRFRHSDYPASTRQRSSLSTARKQREGGGKIDEGRSGERESTQTEVIVFLVASSSHHQTASTTLSRERGRISNKLPL